MSFSRRQSSPVAVFYPYQKTRAREALYPVKPRVWSRPRISFDGLAMRVGVRLFWLPAFGLTSCSCCCWPLGVHRWRRILIYEQWKTTVPILYAPSAPSSDNYLVSNYSLIISTSLDNPFHRPFANMVKLHGHDPFDLQTKGGSGPSVPVLVVP